MSIDLHIHSNASDGTLSPPEIVHAACKRGLRAIAITDHDTIDGSREAVETGIPASLKFLTGIEISADPPAKFPCFGSFHILGYGIRLDDSGLNLALARLQKIRKERNPLIIKKLECLGLDISEQELNSRFIKGQIGRPHIGQLMVEKGFVKTIDQAFDLYLGKNKSAFVDKPRLSCLQAIEIIKNAGGVPVLAHPDLITPLKSQPFEKLILLLKDMGLAGIEAYYSDHSDKATGEYLELARKYDLLATGGTDFHGDMKPQISIGSGKDDLCVPFSLYKSLIQYIDSAKSNRMTNDPCSISGLEKTIEYQFSNRLFIEEASRHSSFVNEQADRHLRDNERFEFLGDAVLNLGVSHLLMENHPNMPEGELSKTRAGLVNTSSLAILARKLNLGSFIQLGKGERQSLGYRKESILADAFEALIAAIYLDGGFDAAFVFISRHFTIPITAKKSPLLIDDHKSRLQEYSQTILKEIPRYRIADEEGPDHDKTFIVEIRLGKFVDTGVGKSKKSAEQDAAKKMFARLNQE